MIEEFQKAASVPRLSPSNYYPIVGMIKKLIKSNKAIVSGLGVKILPFLAKGLRKNFHASAK